MCIKKCHKTTQKKMSMLHIRSKDSSQGEVNKPLLEYDDIESQPQEEEQESEAAVKKNCLIQHLVAFLIVMNIFFCSIFVYDIFHNGSPTKFTMIDINNKETETNLERILDLDYNRYVQTMESIRLSHRRFNRGYESIVLADTVYNDMMFKVMYDAIKEMQTDVKELKGEFVATHLPA